MNLQPVDMRPRIYHHLERAGLTETLLSKLATLSEQGGYFKRAYIFVLGIKHNCCDQLLTVKQRNWLYQIVEELRD